MMAGDNLASPPKRDVEKDETLDRRIEHHPFHPSPSRFHPIAHELRNEV
jgi:hypothetical protein